MKWRVRTGFFHHVSEPAVPEDYYLDDRVVEASSMDAAIGKALREGRKAVVPKGKRVIQIRTRVEKPDDRT